MSARRPSPESSGARAPLPRERRAALAVVPLAVALSGPVARADEPRTVPDAAAEAPRDLERLGRGLADFVRVQRYGAKWTKFLPKSRPPTPSRELSQADSHAGLDADPMEMQAQVRYVEEPGRAFAYGLFVISARRVFSWGRLEAVELAIEPSGKARRPSPERDQDLAALRGLLADPVAKLELSPTFVVGRNELVAADAGTRWPLRIEVRPRGRKP